MNPRPQGWEPGAKSTSLTRRAPIEALFIGYSNVQSCLSRAQRGSARARRMFVLYPRRSGQMYHGGFICGRIPRPSSTALLASWAWTCTRVDVDEFASLSHVDAWHPAHQSRCMSSYSSHSTRPKGPRTQNTLHRTRSLPSTLHADPKSLVSPETRPGLLGETSPEGHHTYIQHALQIEQCSSVKISRTGVRVCV